MAKGILHIGLPKTGSTSSQNAVYRHRSRLLSDLGIFYPSISANLTDALCTSFHDDPRKHINVRLAGIDTREEAEALRRVTLDALDEDIRKQPWDVLVLSAEGLSNFTDTEYKTLAEWAFNYASSWRVLFWSRHPVDFAVSNAQEMVKGGMTFNQMAKELPLPYFEGRIKNAAAAFGMENIELVAFEEAQQTNGGVVAEFCRRIGIPDQFAVQLAAEEPIANTAMPLVAIQLLEALNRHRPLIVDGKRNSRRHFQEQMWLARVEGIKFDLSIYIKMALRQKSRPDVDWLNKTFGTNLYTDVFSDSELTAGPSLPVQTIDTLALMFSDLLLQT